MFKRSVKFSFICQIILISYFFLQTLVLWFEPGGVVWGVTGNQVTNILLLIGLEHEAALLTDHLVLELHGHVVVVGIHGDGLDLRVQEPVHHHLVLGSYKLEAVHVDGQENVTRVGPHPLVLDLEQGTAVQWELFDTGQVPHHGLQLALVLTVMLQNKKCQAIIGSCSNATKQINSVGP